MMKFAQTCADVNLPLFTEECSLEIMSIVGIKADDVKKCISDSISSKWFK